MQMENNSSEQNALTTDKSAAVPGINEFSLFTRNQMDEIEAERLRWGEVAITEAELHQTLHTRAISLVAPPNQEVNWSDSDLGIQKHDGVSNESSPANSPSAASSRGGGKLFCKQGDVAKMRGQRPPFFLCQAFALAVFSGVREEFHARFLTVFPNLTLSFQRLFRLG
jgi:hypothetical protein